MRNEEKYNIQKELVSSLLPTQNVLTDREVDILKMRFLQKDSNFGGWNLCLIGQKHWITPDRVRSIINIAIEKLRNNTPEEYSHQLRLRRKKRLEEATKVMNHILESYKEEKLTSGMVDMFVEVFFTLRNIEDKGKIQLRTELKEKFLENKK